MRNGETVTHHRQINYPFPPLREALSADTPAQSPYPLHPDADLSVRPLPEPSTPSHSFVDFQSVAGKFIGTNHLWVMLLAQYVSGRTLAFLLTTGRMAEYFG